MKEVYTSHWYERWEREDRLCDSAHGVAGLNTLIRLHDIFQQPASRWDAPWPNAVNIDDSFERTFGV